jgi:hypothetical protein
MLRHGLASQESLISLTSSLIVLLLLSLLRKIQERITRPLRRDSSSRIAQWNGMTLLRVFLCLLYAGSLLVTPQNAPLVTDFTTPAATRFASYHFPVSICHRGLFCNTELVPAFWRSIHDRFNHQFCINFLTNRLPSPGLSFLLNIVAWMSECYGDSPSKMPKSQLPNIITSAVRATS